MGEITEALRRAKRERGLRDEKEVCAELVPEESAVVRAGLDSPPPAERVVREPVRIVPAEAEAADVEVARFSRTRTGPWQARTVLIDPREPRTEQFRRFAVRVRQTLRRRDQTSILITSPVRAEGKTFTSCNLALALSSMAAGGRIALLELDARRPAVASALGIDAQVGIEDVLSGVQSLEAARIRTELPSLDLYLVRQPVAEPHEILALRSLENVFRELETRYDTVVVDSPPVLLVPDVSLIVGHVDTCLAVVRAGYSRVKAVREMLGQLPHEKLLGLFVNDISMPSRSDQYGYYLAEDEPQ